MTMSVGDEAWRVMLLIGSGVVASAQIGKAIISYWPRDNFGFIPHERYAGASESK